MKFLLLPRPIGLIAAMAMTVGITSGAIGADVALPTKAPLAPAPTIETWTFSLTPYLWATSLNGHTTVKGVTTDVNAGFSIFLITQNFRRTCFSLQPLAKPVTAAWDFSPIWPT